VKISAKPGASLRPFDGMLTGTMLYVIPGQLIVQRWRRCIFHDADLDSLLIRGLCRMGNAGELTWSHANYPGMISRVSQRGWGRSFYGNRFGHI